MNNPKDKAGDLIVKFIKHSRAEKDIKPIDSAKQCAIILVNEILQHNAFVSTGIKQSIYDYWQEVKTEINNL
jgi:hypothetical protein